MHKAANTPWPVLDSDDVINYMIMEAVAIKAAKEEEDQEKAAERKNWRGDKSGLDKLREMTG